MIKEPTVLILGAGASMPYGFPSGWRLVQDICRACLQVEGKGKFGALLMECGVEKKRVMDFGKALQHSRLLSIDQFLLNRQEYYDVGKLLIAHELIKHENPDAPFSLDDYSSDEPEFDDWYRYIWSKMAGDGDLDKFKGNQISFVTFNYDRSLEYFLHQAATYTFGGTLKDAWETIKRFHIVHLHGRLGVFPWEESPGVEGRKYNKTLNGKTLKIAADGIKIMHEVSESFDILDDLLSSSEHTHLIGFGYHPINLRRLKLQRSKSRPSGTAYGFTKKEIGRIALNSGAWRSKPDAQVLDERNLFPCKIVEYFREHRELI